MVFSTLTVWLSLFFAFASVVVAEADNNCPDGKECNAGCCVRTIGEYYCCPELSSGTGGSVVVVSPFSSKFLPVVIGCVVASIVVSVILSILCCFFCNGCWLHRYRNPQLYSNDMGLPLGFVYIQPFPQPPVLQQRPTNSQGHYEAPASDSSRDGSHGGSQTKLVRFDQRPIRP